jgi:hypothetical protein
MTFSSTSVATGIAALSISGVTIYDLTGIPEAGDTLSDAILFPSPDGWITGGNADPSDGPATFGTASTRLWIFSRTYKYIYLHCAVGAGTLSDIYSGMSTKADAIQKAFTTLDLTDLDVENVSIGEFGAIQDPSGNYFHGFTVSVTMRERLNNE